MVATNSDYTKEVLRAHYLEKRRALPASEWEVLNTRLISQFRHLDLAEATTAHIFLPIRKFGEPDTHRIIAAIDDIRSTPIRWVTSVTDRKTGGLYHFVWDRDTVVRENSWGIPEPIGGYQVTEDEIDVIFVPLLVFDGRGHRVGYGKGYYDRFLAKCRPQALKIGISLFPPIPAIADVFHADIPLDACVTPDGIYRFTKENQ